MTFGRNDRNCQVSDQSHSCRKPLCNAVALRSTKPKVTSSECDVEVKRLRADEQTGSPTGHHHIVSSWPSGRASSRTGLRPRLRGGGVGAGGGGAGGGPAHRQGQ